MIINGKKVKAKDLAEMAGVSRRTVVKYYAMPREAYEDGAAERRRKAYEL
ncbi:HTH domain-containing protein, partial [Escherichia coli]